ncbi:MAG: fibronectin type III domain-containing protein [Bacteroidota bacterium]
MNKHIHLILIIFLSSVLWITVEETNAQTLRILPLGNSITEGWDLTLSDGDKGAYRSHLYSLLDAEGYSFDFEGHLSTGFDVFPDADHGGIPGSRDQYVVTLLDNGYDEKNSEQITPGTEPYLDHYPADIILLHIGTNDMIHAEGDDPAQVGLILDEIDEWEAANGIEVAVFVARIINQTIYSLSTTQYNDNVEAMVALRGDPNIFMVDIEDGAGIDYSVDMQTDGLHVLESGYIKMGQAWFDALDPYLSSVPNAPTALSATALDANTIQLSWTENSANESGYRVERSLSSGSGFSEIDLLSANTTTYTDNSVSEGTQYFYRVYAFNSGGSSTSYASGSASTLPLPPDAPSNLTFGTVTSSSIELNWTDNSDNEDGFEIFRSIYSWGSFSSIGTTAAGVTSFNSTGLTSNTTYYYRVEAYNAGGSSSYVSGNEKTLPEIPAAPSNLSFSAITSASIQLNWTDNSNNEDGFEIFRALSSGGSYTSIATLGPGMTTYNNTGLDPDTEYFYRVYAFNTGGSSAAVSGSAMTLPEPPAAPSNLTSGLITTNSIQLIWTDNSDNEDGFDIYRSLSIGGPYASVATTGPGITSFNDVGLDDDTEYFYRVYAFNTGGVSDPASGSASTLMQVPDAPTKLGAQSNNTCSVDLKWDDKSDNEAGFELERSSTSSTFGFALVQTLGPDVETYVDTSAENYNTYYYRVRAFNVAGTSDYSNVSSVSISEILNGGAIGTDQSICPLGDPDLLFNITSPSGGSNNWTYQWQSRSLTGIFEDVDGATMGIYDPPPGMIETMVYQRISTVECGSVVSNLLTITIEDLEDPLFDSCPEDVIATIQRDQISASVDTEDPLVSDNCEIGTLTWIVSGATIGMSPETGINILGTYEFNLGVSTLTYRATDMNGNFTECSYDVSVEFSPPEILGVSIPDASMKIGDIVSATITTATDGGSPFSMVSGEIGGYPLYNFQAIDETTYLANFEIIENGNSYLATEDIPVTNLIITDGSIPSLTYDLPIIQGNDLLDAELPVIGGVVAETGIYSIGDVVILNISADGLAYEIHPSSMINGILVSEPNILFTELGGGIYTLSYVVQEGDTDVAPGELMASIMLVKPSGNISLPYTEIGNTASVAIDAHAPLITHMEVPDIEVGVGGTVQVTITADEEGYVASLGSIINGIPLSSPRITFSERAGGLYEISYVVDAGDAEVAPGNLSISMVMTDTAGNANEPYTLLEDNTLEIYTDLPIALLAGTPEICEEETAELTVFLEGREPWSFDLYDGSDTTAFEDVTANVYNISIAPLETTSYRILTVRDVNEVENAGSGNVSVTVNEKTPVEIINLASGYYYEADPVKLEADVPGGVFSGPGVFSGTGYFDPGVADTINSPHTIYYTYTNPNGCESVDSALVFVLGANGGIYIPTDLVCQNGDPFMVNASNISGVTGSFTLLDAGGQAVDGLSDNGDNSAEIDPGQLSPGEYTIEYEYVDLVTLYLTRTFMVEAVAQPAILNLEDTYCQTVDPFLLESDTEGVVFDGPGVAGTIAMGFVFDPGAVEPGAITIFCTATSESGCEAVTAKMVTVRFSPGVDFALSSTCIADTGGMVQFDNLTEGKLEVETWSWNFGDPSSGDDNTSDLVNPEHYYASPGERSVSLKATAINGCMSEKILDISIGNNVSAGFTWTSDCYDEDSGILFQDRSTSGNSSIDMLIWRFKTSEGELLDELISTWGSEDLSYQFASSGDYVVELVASNDMGCSDSTSAELSLRETIKLNTEDYLEAFNLDQGAWTVHSENQNESWTWNVPDFDGFVPHAGDKAWFTQLPDDVIDYNEDSWVQSPCFDFTGVRKPMISMEIMRSFVPERDGAVLQYLVNREEGWHNVGDISSGIEWYNYANITNEPGGNLTGWSLEVDNPDQEWVYVAHDLDMLAQVPNAMLRIALGSNGRGGIGNQGFAFDNVGISQRTKLAVIEHFTNSADPGSSSADDFIDAFVQENSSDVVDIQYHMNIPGADPMNENNPGPSATRSFNYGIPSVPYAVLNGGLDEENRFDFSDLKSTLEMEQVLQTALQKPVFDVDLEVNWLEGGLETSTLVTCKADRYDDNIQLYVVVFETSVTQYTGLNGDTEFRNVVLDMLPTPAGKLLGGNWSIGDDDIRLNTWTYAAYVEHTDDLAVIAFVQDRNTNQILQAAVEYKTPQIGIEPQHYEVESLHIYPNPAKSQVNVNLGRPAERDGRFEIIDMNGRVVHNENVPMGYQIYQLEVGSLNRGFYMIQWYEGGMLKGRNKLITVD